MKNQRDLVLGALIGTAMLALVIGRAAAYTVTTTFNDGPGSLRDGINQVNSNLTGIIEFHIPPDDDTVKTIVITNVLPAITNTCWINGYSQPGALRNTETNAAYSLPLIELTSTDNLPGLTIRASGCLIEGLILNGFDTAINIGTNGGNFVVGNFIGTDASGTMRPANTNENGIVVGSANNNIGGPTPADRNLISGNYATGLQIEGVGASNNFIRGNFIGVDATGTNRLGNTRGIVLGFGAARTLIGGTNDGEGNVISGSLEDGIVIADASASGNEIYGNIIGSDVFGMRSGLGNNHYGIVVNSPNNRIGAPMSFTPGLPKGNLISGNSYGGIRINSSAATNNLILNNLIGTDIARTNILGNAGSGIVVSLGNDTQIGMLLSPTLGIGFYGNVIANNQGDGISIGDGGLVDRTIIAGNNLGVDLLGIYALGNYLDGVHLTHARDSRLVDNTIAFNGLAGVAIGGTASSTNNTLTHNRIYYNGDVGIDLAVLAFFEGVTTNDNCDTDAGSPNKTQNFPVLTSVTSTNMGQWVRIDGYLVSAANTEFELEFFANDRCDPSGHGEGQKRIGSTNVITAANCTNQFSVTFQGNLLLGAFTRCSFLVATATDPDGNTSEFSQCYPVLIEDPILGNLCTHPPSGLISWWAGNSNALDNLTVNHGALSNGATFATGMVKGAFSFDGVNDYFIAPDSPSLRPTSFTLDAWVNFSNAPVFGRRTVIAKPVGGGAINSYALWLEGGTLRGAIGANGALGLQRSSLVSNYTPATGVWLHVAYTFDQATTNHALYVNGVLQKSATTSLPAPSYDTHPFLAGTAPNAGGALSDFFAGQIDEVEIFDRALDADELQLLYCAGHAGKCPVFLCEITCPTDVVVTNDTGKCSAIGEYSIPFPFGDCPTLVCDPPSGEVFPVGTTLVTCTTNDVVACTFNMVVKDVEPPDIACPQDITVDVAPGQCSTNVAFTPTGNDNCPGVTAVCVPPSGSAFPVGTNTVNCAATDASGNTAVCSFKVIVKETVPPAITCPADITVDTDPGLCTAVVNFAPTATDNCPGVTVVCNPPSGSTFPKGHTTVTCTATDASGNTAQCVFDVAVKDTENPTITCPGNIAVNASLGECAQVVNYVLPIASDNCPGGPVVACNPPSGTSFNLGANAVNCTATDASGNQANCTFFVIVNDIEPPRITCPADITVPAAQGECGSNVTFNVTAIDNCPGVNVVCVPPSGSPFPVGVTTVNCSATDIYGNTDICSFHVTVTGGITDTQPPVITCPADVSVPAAPGLCSSNVNFTATSTDNCPGVSVVCVPPSGSPFPVGVTTVNCTATDAAGNMDMCSLDVTVNDTENPAVTCPADVVVDAAPNQTSAVVNYPAPVTGDNCPGVNVVCVPASGATFHLGVTMVNCTATDASGNTDTCAFNVTVNSSTGIIVNCSLDPASATNEVNTSHVVTGTVLSNNVPVSGVTLYLRIVSGPNQGKFGKGDTDAEGHVSVSYTGNRGVGVDQISATGSVSGVNLSCSSEKEWVVTLP